MKGNDIEGFFSVTLLQKKVPIVMPTQSKQDPGKGKPIPASPTGEELVTELI